MLRRSSRLEFDQSQDKVAVGLAWSASRSTTTASNQIGLGIGLSLEAAECVATIASKGKGFYEVNSFGTAKDTLKPLHAVLFFAGRAYPSRTGAFWPDGGGGR